MIMIRNNVTNYFEKKTTLFGNKRNKYRIYTTYTAHTHSFSYVGRSAIRDTHKLNVGKHKTEQRTTTKGKSL